MLSNLHKRNKGFTIVEVMIVLAIAGLIILIVFLAVPSLQRRSRNTQRDADASKVLAAVSECLSNRNGSPTACNTQALLTTNAGLDMASLSQITTVTVATADVAANNFNTLNFNFSATCSNSGANMTGSTNSRAYAVAYRNENGGAGITKCIQS